VQLRTAIIGLYVAGFRGRLEMFMDAYSAPPKAVAGADEARAALAAMKIEADLVRSD
jgi:hypothetical protein